MEKGAKASSGFIVSDTKSPPSSSNSDVVGLVKLHSTESFPSKISMMGENNLGRPSGGGGGGGGGGVGPAGSNSGGANDVGGANFTRSSSTNPQPFDIFASSYPTTPYKSPGGGMAASMWFPFTFAQWKELERQAMIYKYMISSVPVPHELLFPISGNFPAGAVDYSASSLYNVRYSKNGDPEPGRCKRTDGKKWRCSRDVAPNQKYCERHLHRGRPRSRKPVEVKKNDENHKKPRFEQSPVTNPTCSQEIVAPNDQPLLLFNAKTDLTISAAPPYKGTNRDLSLMMEHDQTVAVNEAEQRWRCLMEANMGFVNEGSSIYSSSALFNQEFVDQQPLNLSSYSNHPVPDIDAPTGNFIDAWSINNLNSSNNGKAVSSLSTNHENLCPSLNLSIAMAAGNVLDHEMRNVQMGSCVKCYDDQRLKDSRFSWEPFARGGPLAEVLQPGSGGAGCSKPASPHESISTLATTVSSPSGVLHRTLFSHSDSSVCNSPTFVGPTSDVAFHWFG